MHKLFSKTKFKFDSAVFVKTTNNDLSDLTLSKYQMTVFYSPSDVKSLLENFPDFKQGDLQIATFGPATAKAVKEAGLEIAIMAPSPQVPSIAKALELYLEKK